MQKSQLKEIDCTLRTKIKLFHFIGTFTLIGLTTMCKYNNIIDERSINIIFLWQVKRRGDFRNKYVDIHVSEHHAFSLGGWGGV